jgi:MtN3 and saliva related transmembrane protein
MPSTDLIGYLAASLTTAAFLPQAWLTWKTRCADGISLAMYGILTVGIALWLAYGLQLGAMPIVMANLVTLLLACFILIMKIRYK